MKPFSKMIFALAVTAILATLYFVYPIQINANQEKTFLTHSGAVIKTTGQVLDPIYTAQTVEIDPDKYLIRGECAGNINGYW